ncbi:hypothetical protein PLICRDRAFT_439592 [Plicaturopsis crispa FD-325 SS-3]|uniref:Uncharacterized protein n=1 Tax=Plicaturopsis crispa FD-325 SS-3 TaxID=944288 RepID=A0A0C9SQG7_PLICR|nr:hypothetical protein PLICRDRAFT_439592 [Plicaturopsis crispa FD-325 SS-3]
MSTIVKKAHADFEIRATVLYTGLSGLSRTEAHRLFTDLPCGWQLQVNIPQLEDIADDDVANSDSEDTKVDKNPYAGVYVRWPSYVSASPDTYPELLAVIVLRSLDSHRELKAASILIPSGTIMNPGIGYGRPQFMPWQELWGEESVCRKEGGFEIEVSIIPKPSPEMTNSSSTPPKESPPPLPVLSHPTLLTNLCRQIEGKPAVDVQFILFSRRHIQETLVGAKDPRPLFASFDLIRGQSKCLDTLIDDAGASLADGIQPQWVSHDISVDEYDYASDSDLDEDESVDVEVPEVNMDDISKYDSSSDDTTYGQSDYHHSTLPYD